MQTSVSSGASRRVGTLPTRSGALLRYRPRISAPAAAKIATHLQASSYVRCLRARYRLTVDLAQDSSQLAVIEIDLDYLELVPAIVS
jgi:hypothetical protein